MKKHFTISHPEEVIPEIAVIAEEEENLIKEKKSFRKNCLKKEDLERLVGKELALLHISDFWDTKKKKWKSNVYDNFGKQNSVRMKKVSGKENFEWFNTPTTTFFFFGAVSERSRFLPLRRSEKKRLQKAFLIRTVLAVQINPFENVWFLTIFAKNR